MSSFTITDCMHMLQSPPTLLISWLVAFLIGRSINYPWFFLQQQKHKRAPRQTTGEIPIIINMAMNLTYFIPTTTA